MLVIGIDEAGYGPLLGPLVVAGSAFHVPEGEAEPGRLLRRALEGPRRRRGGIRVGDSKELYGRRGLSALEMPVLACLAWLGGACPVDVDALLAAVGVDVGERHERAWYAGDPPCFPLHSDAAAVATAGAEIHARAAQSGVRFAGFAAEVVPEARLNSLFERSGNKGQTLFELSARVLERLLGRAGAEEPVLAVFDRQGGRKNYLPPLQARFPEAFVWRLGESADRSAYRLGLGGRSVETEFVVRGDARHPQVGLASMLAKYLRELYMGLWNGWFAALCPLVRPTAGYTEDGRRWLEESRAARAAAGIPDATLVRLR